MLPPADGDDAGASGAATVDRLFTAGRARLSSAGPGRSTTREVIAAGLWERARAQGWSCPATAAERARRLRLALFEPGAPAPEQVLEAAYAAVERRHHERGARRPDEPLAAYRSWHSGGGTNLPRLIAQALAGTGHDADTARDAIADLCWLSV